MTNISYESIFFYKKHEPKKNEQIGFFNNYLLNNKVDTYFL